MMIEGETVAGYEIDVSAAVEIQMANVFSVLWLYIENVSCLIRASPQYEICYWFIYLELV